MKKLTDIESIGPVYAEKLKAAGVLGVATLLSKGAEKKGRAEIAEKTQISETMILNWVNRADLGRISGVGTQYADLLEVAGVDTVPELAQRNAENLLEKMSEINSEKKLVRVLPSQKAVTDWVAQAKSLPRVVNY